MIKKELEEIIKKLEKKHNSKEMAELLGLKYNYSKFKTSIEDNSDIQLKKVLEVTKNLNYKVLFRINYPDPESKAILGEVSLKELFLVETKKLGISTSSLAQILDVTRPYVNRSVNNLEKNFFIKSLIKLTNAANLYIKFSFSSEEKENSFILKNVEDLKEFISFLQKNGIPKQRIGETSKDFNFDITTLIQIIQDKNKELEIEFFNPNPLDKGEWKILGEDHLEFFIDSKKSTNSRQQISAFKKRASNLNIKEKFLVKTLSEFNIKLEFKVKKE